MPEVEVEVEVEKELLLTNHPTSSTSTREPRTDMDGWQAGDVVVLDNGEVCGRMLTDVVNPWALLNDVDDDGDQVFYEDADIEEHGPELLVRAGKPLVAAGLPGPVDQAELRAAIVEKLTCAGVVLIEHLQSPPTWEPATEREAAMIADALMPEIAPLLARLVAAETRADELQKLHDAARAQLSTTQEKHLAAFSEKHAMRRERDEARARVAQLEGENERLHRQIPWSAEANEAVNRLATENFTIAAERDALTATMAAVEALHRPRDPHKANTFCVECGDKLHPCPTALAAASPPEEPRPGTPAAFGGPISDEPDLPPTAGLRRNSGLLAAPVPPLVEDAPK